MAININSKKTQLLLWVSALLSIVLYGFLRGHDPVGFNKDVSQTIFIDRTQPFDPVELIGINWAIDEQDEYSLALINLDLRKIQIKNMLQKDEVSIKGTENLRRLKDSDYVRLDAAVFNFLWENQCFIPDSWKGEPENKVYVCFDGTILCNSNYSCRFVLCLYYWSEGEEWRWYCRRTNDDWSTGHYSAVF